MQGIVAAQSTQLGQFAGPFHKVICHFYDQVTGPILFECTDAPLIRVERESLSRRARANTARVLRIGQQRCGHSSAMFNHGLHERRATQSRPFMRPSWLATVPFQRPFTN
jgi:hypothetical protein